MGSGWQGALYSILTTAGSHGVYVSKPEVVAALIAKAAAAK